MTRRVIRHPDGRRRCWWCGTDPLYMSYHDKEWGRPVTTDNRLFEKLVLEGFQSGLSWLIILRKRDGFRRAFHGFDIERVARFSVRDVQRLLGDASIVRHRGKIESTINNARRAVDLIDECGSLAAFAWRYEPTSKRPKRLTWNALVRLSPAPEATAMSRDLKKRGWSFVGPTTVYSFMEAMGMVNDHIHDCDVARECEADRRVFARPT